MHQHPTSSTAPSRPSESLVCQRYAGSRPFLKYAGGKQRLLKSLLPLLPTPGPGGRYIEPFLGAGSVLLATTAPTSLAGDTNPDLMALWVAVQARPLDVVRTAGHLFSPENHNELAYRRIRDEFNNAAYRFDRAVRLLYLNRFGFNGLYRVNKSGEFNVPYGRPAKAPRVPEQEVLNASARLKRVALHVGSFEALLSEARAGDVVYCDPPYLADEGQSSFASYTAESFGPDQHRALARLAQEAASRGACIAISNHDNEAVRHLYRGWLVHSVSVSQTLAATPGKRGQRRELLAVPAPLEC